MPLLQFYTKKKYPRTDVTARQKAIIDNDIDVVALEAHSTLIFSGRHPIRRSSSARSGRARGRSGGRSDGRRVRRLCSTSGRIVVLFLN